MPGFSISLTNLSNISSETRVPFGKLLDLIDAPHNSVSWPATSGVYPLPDGMKGRKREEQFIEVEREEKQQAPEGPKISGEPHFSHMPRTTVTRRQSGRADDQSMRA